MIRGNTLIIKTIALISLVVLVNISYANEASNNETDKYKSSIKTTPVDNSKTTLKKSLGTDMSKEELSNPVAQPGLDNHADIGVTNYIQMLFGLFAIVAFIFAVAWLIKRMGTLSPNQSNNLKIIAGLSVGQREKIVVVQVMGEQMLVGITQTNIQLLSKLETPIPVPPMNSLGGFQEKLHSAMNNFKKNSGTGSDV